MSRLSWDYPHGDEAMVLFTWCMQHWQMPLYAGQRLLEVGCAESDFHERVTAIGVDYHGIDYRPTDWGETADVTTWTPPRTFDWVVLLGTLEHIGLGYYGDPVSVDGDRLTMLRCAEWLRPGGFLWCDVPFNPCASVSRDRHYRVYNANSIQTRLSPWSLCELSRMYCQNAPQPGQVTPYAEPVEPGEPFHFVSRWLVKRPIVTE